MGKEVLIQYADMQEEIKDIRRRIQKTEREIEKLCDSIVADSVTCGKKGKKPLRTVKIHGIPRTSIEMKRGHLTRQRKMLELAESRLLEQQNMAEEYIESIDKSEIRIMFRLYFIDNLPCYKVAMQMNQLFPHRRVKYNEENVKKRIQRFFDNVPPCPPQTC